MTSHIALVPLDGSATAEAVLPAAATLARGLGQRLLLLRLYEAPSTIVPEEREGRQAEAEQYLGGVAERLRGEGLDVQTRAAGIEDGKQAGEGIVKQAEGTGAAAIFIATHGRSGPKRWAMGSVAGDVVRAASCPVLVVRAGGDAAASPSAVRRVLVPLDGSATSETALAEGVRVATALGATLDLMQAVPFPWAVYGTAADGWATTDVDDLMVKGADDYLAQVQHRLPAALASERHVLRGGPALGILDHAEKTGADLIVMGTHGRSGVSRLILGSVADQVVRAGTVPVLLVRGTAEEQTKEQAGATRTTET